MLICSYLLMSACEQMSSNSDSDFDELLKLEPKFEQFGFKKNPFSIYPLFTDPKNDQICSRDKGLFVRRPQADDAIKAFGSGRRILIYGEVGSGKSSILNMLLYVARSRQRHMSVRVLISEQNVERAVQEILYTVCMEIIREVKQRKISRPIDSIKKWLVEKRKSDDFYDYMARLIGGFEEETTVKKTTTGSVGGTIGTGAVPGGSLSGRAESEETIETKFKSRVENLPAKVVESYFQDMIQAVEKIGYEGIAFGVDEADHIADIKKVVAMLTVARGIFFASDKQIFIVAGSSELSKRTDVMRGVFDSMIFVEDVSLDVMKRILDKRIRLENGKLSLSSTFEEKAVDAIYSYSGGLPKDGLRLAANALTEAAIENEVPVKQAQVKRARSRSIAHLSEMLEPNELKVFEALGEIGESSPSSDKLQKATHLSRQQADRILRDLSSRHIIRRRKEGKLFKYYV
jgi:type II secretory pathway predicted ATPase ExeA